MILPSSIAAPRSGKLILPVVALLLALLPGQFVLGQTALSEDQIKAGFVLNFIRFIEWPAGSYATPASAFDVCVVGDNPIFTILAGTVVGKEVGGRPVNIRFTRTPEVLRTCNLVFIGAQDEHNASHILGELKGSSALTVSEYPGFAKAGGMLNFYTQDNKVKLEMNLDVATRANLKISAKLIALSRLISSQSTAGGI